jgi:hypothetical protein
VAQLTDRHFHLVTLQIAVGKVNNTQPVVEACNNPRIPVNPSVSRSVVSDTKGWRCHQGVEVPSRGGGAPSFGIAFVIIRTTTHLRHVARRLAIPCLWGLTLPGEAYIAAATATIMAHGKKGSRTPTPQPARHTQNTYLPEKLSKSQTTQFPKTRNAIVVAINQRAFYEMVTRHLVAIIKVNTPFPSE